MKTYLNIFNGVIVGTFETDKTPVTPKNSRLLTCEDTPANRAKYLKTLTKRQAINAKFMMLPDAVRGEFAVAWVAINSRLDENDKAGALACFDTLSIPPELTAQAAEIRTDLTSL